MDWRRRYEVDSMDPESLRNLLVSGMVRSALLIGRLCCLLVLLGSLARATHLLSSLSVSFTVFSQNMVHFGARTRNGCGVSYLIMRNMPKKSEKKPAMRDLILMSFFLGELMSRDSVDNDRLGIVIIEDFTGAALMQSQMYSSDEVRAWGGEGGSVGLLLCRPFFPPPPPHHTTTTPSPVASLCAMLTFFSVSPTRRDR